MGKIGERAGEVRWRWNTRVVLVAVVVVWEGSGKRGVDLTEWFDPGNIYNGVWAGNILGLGKGNGWAWFIGLDLAFGVLNIYRVRLVFN